MLIMYFIFDLLYIYLEYLRKAKSSQWFQLLSLAQFRDDGHWAMFSNSCPCADRIRLHIPMTTAKTPIPISINIQGSSMSDAITPTHPQTHTHAAWISWVFAKIANVEKNILEWSKHCWLFDIIEETLTKLFVLIHSICLIINQAGLQNTDMYEWVFEATSFWSRFLTDRGDPMLLIFLSF